MNERFIVMYSSIVDEQDLEKKLEEYECLSKKVEGYRDLVAREFSFAHTPTYNKGVIRDIITLQKENSIDDLILVDSKKSICWLYKTDEEFEYFKEEIFPALLEAYERTFGIQLNIQQENLIDMRMNFLLGNEHSYLVN